MLLVSSFLFVTTEVNAKNLSLDGTVSIMDYDLSTDYDRVDNFDTNCQDFAHTLRIGGYLIVLVKVLIPIIIIVKASLNLLHAVTGGKSEELKKWAKQLGYSFIAGALIFFVPTIVNVAFGFISAYNTNITEDSKICTACIFDPFSEACTKYADKKEVSE